MTVNEAIREVREVGTIRAENGKLRLRFPETERPRLEAAIQTLRLGRETALQTLNTTESDRVTIPPAAEWPQSLSEVAAKAGQHSGDSEAAHREVWMERCEWKAAALNRLFQEQGIGGQAAQITAKTVRHGERKRAANRRDGGI